MKYLKYFENLNSSLKDHISSICHKYNIINYTISEDGTVDVDGDVDLSPSSEYSTFYKEKLNKIPLKFGNVGGNFMCSYNKLESLDNCPKRVSGHFVCHSNNLTSLKGCPEYVGETFNCSHNKLVSLEGCPKKVNIFLCYDNNLETFEGGPKYIDSAFDCSDNLFKNLLPFRNIIVRGEIEVLGPFMKKLFLPKEVVSSIEDGINVKDIIKWQDDYLIWNKDGSLNKENFQELLDNLK